MAAQAQAGAGQVTGELQPTHAAGHALRLPHAPESRRTDGAGSFGAREGAGCREEGPWPVKYAVVTRDVTCVVPSTALTEPTARGPCARRLTGGLPIPRDREAPTHHPEASGRQWQAPECSATSI